MTTIEIITWVAAPIAIAAFISSYTLMMLKIDSREKIMVDQGIRDDEIVSELKTTGRRFNKTCRGVAAFLECLLFVLLIAFILTAVYTTAFGDDFPLFGRQVRLVGSNSMASVHESNEYISQNGLTKRFTTDDLIVVNALPAEDDLKLYDIVLYKDKSTGKIIIHRIIKITVLDNKTVYTLRGDANSASDKAIEYKDMRGIYGGTIKNVGALVRFAQSPFGIIAVVTCFYIAIVEEVLNKRINKLDLLRLITLDEAGALDDEAKELLHSLKEWRKTNNVQQR